MSGLYRLRLQFRHMLRFRVSFFFAFVVLLFSVAGAVLSEAATPKAASTEADLRELRSQIEKIQAQMTQDVAERDRLARGLRAVEKSAGAARIELQRVQAEREGSELRSNELLLQKQEREKSLAQERENLSAQIQAAYRIGQQEPLKLLLNQRAPEHAARLLAYYGYFGRLRADQISHIEGYVSELIQLEVEVTVQKEQLTKLAEKKSAQVNQLDKARTERGRVLAALTLESQSRAANFARLKREQSALEKLLSELRRVTPKFPIDIKSAFGLLRGKLAWPVEGKIVSRFGESRAGAVKWDGVLITAGRGTPIKAIHQGRVVYADWLAGLGLLIILDHGDGYISLYAHNEQLFQSVGARVVAGETIASVGDTGGRSVPQLYFEIRHMAKAVNPEPWFRDRAP